MDCHVSEGSQTRRPSADARCSYSHGRRRARHGEVAQRRAAGVGERVRGIGTGRQTNIIADAQLHRLVADAQLSLAFDDVQRLFGIAVVVELITGVAWRNFDVRATERA